MNSVFRSSLLSTVREVHLDTCLPMAINNLTGQVLMENLDDFFKLLAKVGKRSKEDVLLDFVLEKGFQIGAKMPFDLIPYFSNGEALALGIKERVKIDHKAVGRIASCCNAFNLFMGSFIRTTHCLIRLDQSPLHGWLTINSHMLAARYNGFFNSWELQDNQGPWVSTLHDQNRGQLLGMLTGAHTIFFYELEESTSNLITGFSELDSGSSYRVALYRNRGRPKG